MLRHAMLTALWGGLLALERRAFLQAMLSRPLVAGAATGLIFQDVSTGLFVGVFFELLHVNGASLGGSHPDDELLPSVCAAALACAMGASSGSGGTPAMWAVAIMACAPLGGLGRRIEGALDVRAQRYLGRAKLAAEAEQWRRAARQNLRAMWPHFVVTATACMVSVAAGLALGPVVAAWPLGVARGFAWAYPMMTVVAASIGAAQVQARWRTAVIVLFAALGAGAAGAVNGVPWP